MALRPGAVEALIGFGSNLGDRVSSLAAAVGALGGDPGIRVRRVSSLYRTSPVGCGRQPWFYNGAALVLTRHLPAALVGVLLRVERGLGRRRPGGKRRSGGNEARVIDLDLLVCGDDLLARGRIAVPHPRMHERSFVLTPCAEIAPDFIHPALGVSVRSLLDDLRTGETVTKLPSAVQRRFRRLIQERVTTPDATVRNSKVVIRDVCGAGSQAHSKSR